MKQNRKRSERRPVKRLCPTPETGLTEEQAAQRRAAGWNNAAQDSLSKTEWQIVRDNVFTFFNFVFVALAACLFAVGAYRDMMFLGIVAANVFIGIVQELRVKRTLDKVTLLSGSTACVVRGGRTRTVPTDELVLDDIVLLRPGSQVCADAVVADGTLEVNEALLTGEAELVQKRPGDTLLSGSFVVTGACAARLDKVGTDCYAARITGEARRRKRHRSEMMRALDRLLRFISIAIIPVFVIMFAKQYFFLHTGLEYAMSSTVAAIIGMIPEGLYLLVSVALAVSVISLARSKTLVHELSCIENLARVDTLCLDKTGTITEGCMEVLETIPVPGMEGGALAELLGSFTAAAGEDNTTAQALRARFGALGGGWQPKAAVPFSSERKWGALVLKDGDEYILGAPEIVLGGGYAAFRGTVEPQLAAGRRVLVLARGHGVLEGGTLQHDPQALGFVVLSDKIRADAPATLAYFKAQGVDVKVISGDNAVSVAEVARRAGVEGAEHYLDMSRVPEDADLRGAAQAHAVFGRVTPQQKRALICALKDTGRTVAMIGDGVNDVLALKDADCSIAMAAGSEAAQHVAQLVLLSSNFSAMPQIVKEGRRVINNIERSATLFLVKNIFSFVVSLVLLFAAMPYPLVPTRQLYAQRAAERTARRAGQCGEPAGCDVDRLRDGPSHGADFHCVHTAGRHGRIYGAAVFVLASVQMALCHRGRHGRGLHRRMRPAGAAVRPFPSFRACVDAAGRICRRHSRADVPVRVPCEPRQAETAPFPARQACRRAVCHTFLKHIFLYFTARSAFRNICRRLECVFSAPHRPQLEFNSKKPHLRSTSAPLYTRRSYVTMEPGPKETKGICRNGNANRKNHPNTAQTKGTDAGTACRGRGRYRRGGVQMGDGQCLPGYSAAVPSGAGVGHHTRHTAGFSASSFRGRTESHLGKRTRPV